MTLHNSDGESDAVPSIKHAANESTAHLSRGSTTQHTRCRSTRNTKMKSGRVSKAEKQQLQAVGVFHKLTASTRKICKALERVLIDIHKLDQLLNECSALTLNENGPQLEDQPLGTEQLAVKPGKSVPKLKTRKCYPKDSTLQQSNIQPLSSPVSEDEHPNGHGTDTMDTVQGQNLDEAEDLDQYYAQYHKLYNEVSASQCYADHPKAIMLMKMHKRLSETKARMEKDSGAEP